MQPATVNCSRRGILALLLACFIAAVFSRALFAADTEYKNVRVEAATNAVRVRVPLTDVTGKVRPKQRVADGEGEPIAPTKTKLGAQHYLEWQIGYDTRDANAPTAVKEIRFERRGEVKYGAELTKIVVEALRLGLVSTNELRRELERLGKLSEATLEEREGVRVEKSPAASDGKLPDGFTRWTQKTPRFVRETAHGWIEIQFKPRQRAVGNQAMIYVCLPMTGVRAADGSPRPPGPARTKETVFYDFDRANAGFLLDIVRAFGIASRQHNEDMGKILGRILGQ
ncbi:MAG: R.Pab1 family restriction endonuclease [Verrucomicrobia bacterium]|nr:R.Pab1 family restriction endonuclease [Verrucomicrobiota bacterium]